MRSIEYPEQFVKKPCGCVVYRTKYLTVPKKSYTYCYCWEMSVRLQDSEDTPLLALKNIQRSNSQTPVHLLTDDLTKFSG